MKIIPKNIKDLLKRFKKKLPNKFQKAWDGKEKIDNIYIWWGILPYIFCYLVLNKIIKINNILFIDNIISLIIVAYFILHIILIRKNNPKPPKLTKEEKAKLKEERRKDFLNRTMRKLFLKEPLTQFRPALVYGAIDLFIITHFIGIIL